MALWRSKGARKDAVRGTAPIEVRKSDALMFTGPGVLPGSASPLVTGTSGWTYQVGKAGFVTSRGESDGSHVFGNDGVVTIGTSGVGSTVPVAPGGGLSRWDVIWVYHPAAGENADVTSEPVFGVTSGTPAASPVAPTIPAGALELARNQMTSSATSTGSTGNSISNTAARSWLFAAPAGMPAVTSTTADGTPTSGTSTARDDVLGTYTFRSLAGRQYRVVLDGMLINSRDAGAIFEVRIAIAPGFSAPGTGSSIAAITQVPVPVAGATGRQPVPLSGAISPGPGVFTIAVLTTLAVGTGIGTPVARTGGRRQLYVQDMGPTAPAPVA